jgi:hypothetical protein
MNNKNNTMKKIALKIIFLLLLPIPSFTQSTIIDTIALISANNILIKQMDTLQFDLYITRTSDRWLYYANGTFVLDFDTTGIQIDPTKFGLEYIPNTSDLPVAPPVGDTPLEDAYLITPRVLYPQTVVINTGDTILAPGRFSITVSGPLNYPLTKLVPRDSIGIKIGQFILYRKYQDTLPIYSKLRWMAPSEYYQACAYKLDHDSLLAPYVVYAYQNDNFEMDNNGLNTAVKYQIHRAPEPEMRIECSSFTYAGVKKVKLVWKTLKEAYNKGFIIRRGIRPFNIKDPTKVDYSKVIARYDGPTPQEQALKGLGTSPFGKDYQFIDSAEYRGETYCYLIQYEDFNGKLHDACNPCIEIPHAVIEYTQANPNPFSTSTKIVYRLLDKVILTAKVYDLTGKVVKVLFENEERDRGEYIVEFLADELASQGLYEVIFVAYPVDDPSVEISRSAFKMQLIR